MVSSSVICIFCFKILSCDYFIYSILKILLNTSQLTIYDASGPKLYELLLSWLFICVVADCTFLLLDLELECKLLWILAVARD